MIAIILTAIMRTVSELIFSEEALQRSSISFFLCSCFSDFSSKRLKSGNNLFRLFIAISDSVKRFNLVEIVIDLFEFLSDSFDV